MSNTVDSTDGVCDQVEIGFGFKTHEAALGPREVTASPSPPEVSKLKDTRISVGLYRAPNRDGDTGATFTTSFYTPFGVNSDSSGGGKAVSQNTAMERCYGVWSVVAFIRKECAGAERCALIGYDAEGSDAPLLYRLLDECRVALPENVDFVNVPREYGRKCDLDTGTPDEERGEVRDSGRQAASSDERRRFGSDSVAHAINGVKRGYDRATSETVGSDVSDPASGRPSERPLERSFGALVKAITAECAYRQMMRS